METSDTHTDTHREIERGQCQECSGGLGKTIWKFQLELWSNKGKKEWEEIVTKNEGRRGMEGDWWAYKIRKLGNDLWFLFTWIFFWIMQNTRYWNGGVQDIKFHKIISSFKWAQEWLILRLWVKAQVFQKLTTIRQR